MNTFTQLISALIIAVWLIAIAVISIQNITPISLAFLNWQSFALPLGIVLAFSAGGGLIFGAIIPALLGGRKRRSIRQEEDPLENWEGLE